MSQNGVGLGIGLNTSNDFYTCFRRKTNVMCTRVLPCSKAPHCRQEERTGNRTKAKQRPTGNKMSSWCDENRMVVNIEKSKVMIVTTRQHWQPFDKTDINICIKGDKLPCEMLFVLHVDNFLNWKAHI